MIKGEDELQTVVKSLVTNLCSSDEFISQLTATTTERIGEKYTKEIQELRRENEMISEKLRKFLVEHQEKQEQRSRNKNIRVYGVPEKNTENTMELFEDICVGKMNLQVIPVLKHTYRIGKKEYNQIGRLW
ncbi:hypothetical protein JTB14_024259 [Gonioctena quinquepunctata]|nr:hypothetical protein JTB14_024259 [Gonioctena quinquepunctata]